MTDIKFDNDAYSTALRLAGNAFRNASGKTNKWAQQSLAALLLNKKTMLEIAILLYREMEPKNAKGKPESPKERDNGTISVSSLRGGAGNECDGGELAKKSFDTLQYIWENKDILPKEVGKFAVSGGKMHTLASAIRREKTRLAREAAENDNSETDVAKEPAEQPESDTDTPSVAERIATFNEWLATITPEQMGDAEQLAIVQVMETIGKLDAAMSAQPEAISEAA